MCSNSTEATKKLPNAVKMTDIKIKFPKYLNALKLKRNEREKGRERGGERKGFLGSSQECRILINCN